MLAVKASDPQQWGEIIKSDETFCYLQLADGKSSYCKKSEFADGTFLGVAATKVFKADGSWMYYADGKKGPRNMTGTQWFTRGGAYV